MKYLSREGLVYLWGKMKDTFALKEHTLAKGQYEVLVLDSSVIWPPQLPGSDSASVSLTTTLTLDPSTQCILVRPDTSGMREDDYQALAEAGLYASDAKAHQITLTALNASAAKALNIKIVVSIVG